MLNQTALTQQQLQLAQSLIVGPSLIILFIAIFLVFFLIGLILVKKSRGKFLIIWLFSFIVSGIILAGICLMPNLVIKIAGWFG